MSRDPARRLHVQVLGQRSATARQPVGIHELEAHQDQHDPEEMLSVGAPHPVLLDQSLQAFRVGGHKQALLPQGADLLPNPQGTAPGILWQPRPGLHLMTFPGVPRELYAMWQTTAIAYLQTRGWSNGIIHSRTLKFWGTSESGLAAKVDDFLKLENPTVAPYADDGVIKLRISAKADTLEAAQQLIEPVANQLKTIGGIDCFGEDEDTLGHAVGRLLLERHATLAVAESCTGGGLGAMITAVPGSSADEIIDQFSGAFVWNSIASMPCAPTSTRMLSRDNAKLR